jgi:hypothetical protein
VRWDPRELERLRQDMRQSGRRTAAMVAGGSLVIASALLMTLGPGASLLAPGLSGGLFAMGAGLGATGLAVLALPWLDRGP